METGKKDVKQGLSSEKREDLWAIILAVAVMLCCMAAPDFVHDLFKKGLFLF